MSDTKWKNLIIVDQVNYAFPAHVIGILIPEWQYLPEQFRDGNSCFEELASHACFNCVELKPEVVRVDVDLSSANRQLSAVSRSFEPEHKYKEAALAYLLSLWLREDI
jgi:hypothetical protein